MKYKLTNMLASTGAKNDHATPVSSSNQQLKKK